MKNLFNSLIKNTTEARFLVIGIWNTIFGYGAFFLLDDLFYYTLSNKRFSYVVAMIVAQILAVLNAFIGHKYFTFRSKASGKGLLFELSRFFSSYTLIFVFNLLTLPLLVEFYEFNPKIAAAFLIPASMILNYILLTKFTFLKTDRF